MSLDVTTGSSLYTGTIPDMDLSSSSLQQSPGDLPLPSLPPSMQALKSSAQLVTLRSLGSRAPGAGATLPPEEEEGRTRTSSHHPDGALSSSGVWTASEGEREEVTPRLAEVHPASTSEATTSSWRIEARPNSSLSTGVISDCSTWVDDTSTSKVEEGDSTLREEDTTLEEGSIHSCDTEGYYTTFHDFDGLQEVLHEVDLVIREEEEVAEEERKVEKVVMRVKRGGRPPPPQRWSSLGRESTGTIIAKEEEQEREEGLKSTDKETKEDDKPVNGRETREGSAVSNDLSFDSEERRQRIEEKTTMVRLHTSAWISFSFDFLKTCTYICFFAGSAPHPLDVPCDAPSQ